MVVVFYSLNSFPPGSFGVELGFYQNWIKKNAPPNFYKEKGSSLLLIPHPAKAGTAGFIEKKFEKFVGVNVACR